MKNILIVADDGSAPEGLNRLLSSFGYGVVSDSRGPFALLLLTSGMPEDLVIIDCLAWSVEMNNALQYVRLQAPHVPVIVLTAQCSFEKYLQTMSLGAYEYLIKPVADEDIIRTVKTAAGPPRDVNESRAAA
jgi:two-component system NtrC family response regulator